ncbi:1139_t:CDS:1 [Paraglomus occultum]|uniref:1139_t:CDS:1 n=1 Tax=Paraglomus occultum TaxID=144539 RepID=A0A9N9GTC2_9GLOM|nr:1139_t:CDS:1 [Paraglomus occultum]
MEFEFLRAAYNNIDTDSTFIVDISDPDMQNTLMDFMRSGLVTYAGRSRLQYAAPLIRIIMGKRLYTHRLGLAPSGNNFEQFLRLSIERMRPSELCSSLSHGLDKNSRLLERAWQKEWTMAASTAVPSGHTISPDVGAVFRSSGFLNFYINGGLNWGVELMREGERMSQHINRFKPKGTYENIPLTAWAIIDFRHNSLIPNCQTMEDNIWYALYANDYSIITIMRKDKTDETIRLRGDDPELFPNDRQN